MCLVGVSDGIHGLPIFPVEDKCLGCATVDLSPLGYGMPLLSGWYNVADVAGQCVGQLQVEGLMHV